MTSLFQSYATWVRENRENVGSIERFSHLFAMIITDPRNLITKELAWTLVNLQSFTHTVITTTPVNGRRLRVTDHFILLSRVIPHVECLIELLLRRYCGHRAAWNVLLILQSVKCTLNALVHRQLFLVPWVWAALRRKLRKMLRSLQRSIGMRGRRRFSVDAANNSNTNSDNSNNSNNNNNSTGAMRWGAKLFGGGSGRDAAAVGPGNTTLVIPRVAARRPRNRTTNMNINNNNNNNNNNYDDEDDDENDSCGVGRSAALPCTALDLLGVVVDLLLLLRPLLLLICARRVFPYGKTDIATVPYPITKTTKESGNSNNNNNNNNKQSASDIAELQNDALFILHAALKDGTSRSLMSNWGVWFTFFGFDVLLSLISRYIRRHRVPVVFINNEENDNNTDAVVIEGGEVPSRNGEKNGSMDHMNNNNINNTININGNVVLNSDGMPPLPQPPVGDVAAPVPVTSRDALRVQQALRNIGFSFLQDPFFSAVLQKFVYDHFVVGRVNHIPLLGSLIAFQASYFLCKQHYCFMYSIGQ